MSKRNDLFLLQDILECIEKINKYILDLNLSSFLSDEKTQDAVARNFEIIGEAANRLPDNFKDQHAMIDWRRLRGFRNRIVHDYFGIDYSIVWEIKESFLPTP